MLKNFLSELFPLSKTANSNEARIVNQIVPFLKVSEESRKLIFD